MNALVCKGDHSGVLPHAVVFVVGVHNVLYKAMLCFEFGLAPAVFHFQIACVLMRDVLFGAGIKWWFCEKGHLQCLIRQRDLEATTYCAHVAPPLALQHKAVKKLIKAIPTQHSRTKNTRRERQ